MQHDLNTAIFLVIERFVGLWRLAKWQVMRDHLRHVNDLFKWNLLGLCKAMSKTSIELDYLI